LTFSVKSDKCIFEDNPLLNVKIKGEGLKKSIKIGLIGYGTVGKGVAEIFEAKKDILSEKVGAELVLKKICDKTFKKKSEIFTPDPEEVLNDPEIEIFVELIGGIEPAKRFILAALERGMDVVTANKNVISEHFTEILNFAKRKRRRVYFEASVCAGIPIIAAINEGLCANKIKKIAGILNGTTNFILTEMSEKQENFKKALKTAQEFGFAESNPSLDIEGIDTASKLAILSSIIFGSHIKPSDIYIKGITDVDVLDIKYGRELGYELKLLAVMDARDDENGIFLEVSPVFVKKNHPLASVKGEYNAVFLLSDEAGPLMFYGKGAGSHPAASAVVSDIVYVARHRIESSRTHIPFVELKGKGVKIQDIYEMESGFYLRFTTVDRPGVLAQISKILAEYEISISAVLQKEISSHSPVPIIVLTHKAKFGNVLKALEKVDGLSVVKKKTVFYRIAEV